MTNTVKPTVGSNPSTVNYFDHVKKFSTGSIFGLYFLKFLLALLCLGVMGGIVMIPFIAPAEVALTMFDFEFAGCTSIFNVLFPVVTGLLDGSKALVDLDPYIGAALIYGILLLIGIIWGVIKLIRALILMIFAAAKKKAIVTEMIASIQHKEHIYGMLKVDGLFFYSIIVVGLIFVSTYFDLETLIGMKAFTPFHNVTLINFGSVCVFASVGILLIVGLLFLICRGNCKRKIKKHFGIR